MDNNEYRIELGIGLNKTQLNDIKQILKSIETQERKIEYDVDFNIKNIDKLKTVSKEIEDIRGQLNKGKSKDVLPIDTVKVEKSLSTIHNDIKKLQNAFGKVDSKKVCKVFLLLSIKLARRLIKSQSNL